MHFILMIRQQKMGINLTPICVFRKFFQTCGKEEADSLSSGIDCRWQNRDSGGNKKTASGFRRGADEWRWTGLWQTAGINWRANTGKDWGSRRKERKIPSHCMKSKRWVIKTYLNKTKPERNWKAVMVSTVLISPGEEVYPPLIHLSQPITANWGGITAFTHTYFLLQTRVSNNPDLHICGLLEETRVLRENPARISTFHLKTAENQTWKLPEATADAAP